MDSLENELKRTELLEGRVINLSDAYKDLIKKLHEIGPLVIAAESSPTKAKCQEILRDLCDMRLRGIPEFEKLIREIKQERIVHNFKKRKPRTEEQLKHINSNFEKIYKPKTNNHE